MLRRLLAVFTVPVLAALPVTVAQHAQVSVSSTPLGSWGYDSSGQGRVPQAVEPVAKLAPTPPGSPLDSGVPFTLSSGADASIAHLARAGGRVHAVWAAGGFGLEYRSLDPVGRVVSWSHILDPGGPVLRSSPAIAATSLDGDDVYVTATADLGATRGIVAVVFVSHDGGQSFSPPYQLSSTPDPDAGWFTAVAASRDDVAVAWYDYSDGYLHLAMSSDAGRHFDERLVDKLARGESDQFQLTLAQGVVTLTHTRWRVTSPWGLVPDALQMDRYSTTKGFIGTVSMFTGERPEVLSMRTSSSGNGYLLVATSQQDDVYQGIFKLELVRTGDSFASTSAVSEVAVIRDCEQHMEGGLLPYCGVTADLAINTGNANEDAYIAWASQYAGWIYERHTADGALSPTTTVADVRGPVLDGIAATEGGIFVSYTSHGVSPPYYSVQIAAQRTSTDPFRVTEMMSPDPASEPWATASAVAAVGTEYVALWTEIAQAAGHAQHVQAIFDSTAPATVELKAADLVQATVCDDPGQACFGRLVADKLSVVRVRIASGRRLDLPVDVTLQANGGSAQTIRSDVNVTQPGEHNYYVLTEHPFVPQAGTLHLEVQLRPRAPFQATDALQKRDYTVKVSITVRIEIIPVQVSGSQGPSSSGVEQNAILLRHFLQDAFPLGRANVVVNTTRSTLVVAPRTPATTEAAILAALKRRQDGGSNNYAVGVVTRAQMNAISPPDQNGHVTGGEAAINSTTFVLADDTNNDSVGAHELAHALGFVKPRNPDGSINQQYDNNHLVCDTGHGPEPCTAPGYSVDLHQDMAKAGDFMFPEQANVLCAPELDPSLANCRWVTPYTYAPLYGKLVDNAPDPQAVSISGTISAAGQIVTGPWWEGDTTLQAPGSAAPTLRAEALDSSQHVLTTADFEPAAVIVRDGSAGSSAIPLEPAMFSVVVPTTAQTRTIRLVRKADNTVLYERSRTPHAPTVAVEQPASGTTLKVGDTVNVAWTMHDEDGDPLTARVDLSTDRGVTWQSVAADLTGTEAQLPLTPDLATKSAVIRVTVSDGWNTTEALSGTFRIETNVANGPLLFSGPDDQGQVKLYQIQPDGTGLHPLEIPGYTSVSDPVVSPDGKSLAALAYWAAVPGWERTVLIFANVDGTNPHIIFGDQEYFDSVRGQPSWSPDGNQLVFHGSVQKNTGPGTTAEDRGLVIVNRDGSGAHIIVRPGEHYNANCTYSGCPDGFKDVAWSPDGNHIVYSYGIGSGGGLPYALFLTNTDGQSLQDIGQGDHPAWSSDGTRIAYDGVLSSGTPRRVVVYDLATSTSAPLTSEGNPTWSPDGRLVMAQTGAGACVVEVATGNGPCFPLVPWAGKTLTAEWDDTWPSWVPAVPSAEPRPAVQADAGGPYTVPEGSQVTLDASRSTASAGIASFSWDLNSDGNYGDATGMTTQASFPGDGQYTVSVLVTDTGGHTASAATTVTVTNSPPAMSNLTAIRSSNGTITLTGQASDPGTQDVLSATVDWGTGAQPATLAASGSAYHLFASTTDAAATAAKVTVADDDGATASASVEIVPAPADAPPAAADVQATTDQDQTVTVSTAGEDPDDPLLSVELMDPPTHGTAAVLNGEYVPPDAGRILYNPASGFVGTDHLTYRFRDRDGAISALATVTITVQTVAKASTRTALTSSLNPALYAQAVTLTAKVSASGGTPTGSVSFRDGNSRLGSTSLSSGVATLRVSTLAPGLHAITAAYTGDGHFAGSTSSSLSQLVQKTAPIYPIVRRGDISLSGVRTIQFLLRSNPSPRFAIAADGVFGPRTQAAVRLFQRVNRLAADGIVGQATWRKLVVTQQFGSRGEQVRAIQALLNIYGQTHAGYRLAEDGIFGPLTRGAVIRFQQAASITGDGVVGPVTWPFLVYEAVHAEAAH